MKIQETYEWRKIYEQGLIDSADIGRKLNISKTKIYQILRKNYCPAKSTVYAKETFTDKSVLLFKKQELSHRIV